uniref:ATP synthase F0 subunit 8 n=1 Tax=Galerucella nipponensis TaxID=416328 RepID=UPI002027C55D|nr:ATP synthase F0 subunit 8 [Galerucella nipponensis]YP_010483415.1 ATP synthase F0 subunit 8 [Galerucella birmanica]UQJ77622.1 ATP synthase F0 subunit 8 [Galerucella nipponensis]UVV35475.1 ATP synthase F0 subunit 8 [Galerucella birmanica]
MPQMMPLYWLSLMLFFIMIYFLFNNMNYFNFFYNIKNKKNLKIKLNYNWKW